RPLPRRPRDPRPQLRGDALMELFEAMRKRRAHRFFSADPVDDELLAQLVWAADRAPHGGGQLYRLVVVVNDRALVKTIEQVSPALGVFSQSAPAVIVICSVPADAEAAGGVYARDVATHIDAGASAENIALAAPALGLGTCFVTGFNESAIR